MTVRAHRHEITLLLFDPLRDFACRIPIRQLRFDRYVFRLKFLAHALQIRLVLRNFLTDRIGTVGSCCPAVRHMQQDNATASELRQKLDMFDDCAIRRLLRMRSFHVGNAVPDDPPRSIGLTLEFRNEVRLMGHRGYGARSPIGPPDCTAGGANDFLMASWMAAKIATTIPSTINPAQHKNRNARTF
jgi:hypothetical protein